MFDNLASLPHYSETAGESTTSTSVTALRDAAVEAHAAMVVTHYHGHIPAAVHNAIDWLTRRWNHSALHANRWPSSARWQVVTAGSRRATTPKNPAGRGKPRHRTGHGDHPARGRHRLAEQASIATLPARPATLTYRSSLRAKTTPLKPAVGSVRTCTAHWSPDSSLGGTVVDGAGSRPKPSLTNCAVLQQFTMQQ